MTSSFNGMTGAPVLNFLGSKHRLGDGAPSQG
jgi:hypothetical protein